MTNNSPLTDHRQAVDAIDTELINLLTERTKLSQKIGRLKRTDTIFRPLREKQVVARLCAQNPSLKILIPSVWRAIISASLATQNPDFTIAHSPATTSQALLFSAGQLRLDLAQTAFEMIRRVADKKSDIAILSADEVKQSFEIIGPTKPSMITASLPIHLPAHAHSAFILAPPETAETGYTQAVYLMPDGTLEIAKKNRYDENASLPCLGFVQ